jgi:HEPN domain-containing protein
LADNHPAAARKHVLDSEALLRANRYDGAGYLAGYAVECTLKTMILVEGQPVPRNHDLNRLSNVALRLASIPAQKTAKYASGPVITSLTYGPGGWRETLRYEPEGAVVSTDCVAWVSEARRLYDAVIAQMRLDGVLA